MSGAYLDYRAGAAIEPVTILGGTAEGCPVRLVVWQPDGSVVLIFDSEESLTDFVARIDQAHRIHLDSEAASASSSD